MDSVHATHTKATVHSPSTHHIVSIERFEANCIIDSLIVIDVGFAQIARFRPRIRSFTRRTHTMSLALSADTTNRQPMDWSMTPDPIGGIVHTPPTHGEEVPKSAAMASAGEVHA